ncbi:hypothetical protein EVAR_10949_1 [Eumeta japonica]|uniref:Uncharacterized protein n=1 Tax=Eumeta variegata TaxID=151549 RepID=A0A4C1U641_EUMVA|nr:hypothetical protein EVAR_10949_1 [Eumeta japonica]
MFKVKTSLDACATCRMLSALQPARRVERPSAPQRLAIEACPQHPTHLNVSYGLWKPDYDILCVAIA